VSGTSSRAPVPTPKQRPARPASGVLVARGLRALTRGSWTVTRISDWAGRWMPLTRISPDGKRICVFTGEWDAYRIRIHVGETWGHHRTLAARPCRVRFDGKPVTPVPPVSGAWCPQGRYVVLGSHRHEGVVRIFDAWAAAEWGDVGGHRDDVAGLAWSPGGEWIASASACYDRRVQLFRCAYVERLVTRELESVRPVAERRTLAGYGPRRQDRARLVWSGFYGFEHVCFSPDGSRLAVLATVDEDVSVLSVLTVPELHEVARAPLGASYGSLVWVEAERVFAIGYDAPLVAIDPATGAVLERHAGRTGTGLAVTPGADRVAFAHGGDRIGVDLVSASGVTILGPTAAAVDTIDLGPDPVLDLRWIPARGTFIAVTEGGTVAEWWPPRG